MSVFLRLSPYLFFGGSPAWEGEVGCFIDLLHGGYLYSRVILGSSNLTVRQTIGVVERGWWMGDGISSGLMGLAYGALTLGGSGYDTVVGSL